VPRSCCTPGGAVGRCSGIEGLIATFVLGALFGVLVAAAVAGVFAVALRRLPRVGSDA